MDFVGQLSRAYGILRSRFELRKVMAMYLYILLAIGIVIVLGLSAVAGYYLWQLHLQRKQLSQVEAEQERVLQEQRKRLNNSIQRLAQGVIGEQLTKTEAAIRIRVLLDGLGVDDEVRKEYTAFYILAGKTDHIPILEEWKKLPSKEKKKFDKERESLEKEYGDFVLDAAQRILGKTF
ncbi:DUF2489 domain-containing protein [Sessilibacter corallicola]|uniref:DUF2489 domain-containing protein n=1 Tax=Sessilibacter corallicola TaxID=2904075 RepID=A0ABQ0AD01_9GAMM